MKKLPFFLALFFYYLNSTAQVTGVKNVPGDYASLNAAITALNASGVGAGGATINIAVGYNETAPAGGYQLGSAVLNASTSATKQLRFTGSNNIITAPVGTSTNLDGIFTINGTDYVTISGLIFRESAANNTATTAMEFCIGFFNFNSSAPFDGCQYNTVKSCSITLNRTVATSSKGIFMSHQTAGSTTILAPTAAGDMHSYNAFYSNEFTNMISAVYLGGTTSANDVGNDIGGSSATTGNDMSNVIGALYSSVGAVTCTYQTNCNISNNIINNTANGGTNSIATSWGIYAYGPSCTFTINNNNITLLESAISAAYAVYGIYGNAAGANITAQNNTLKISETGGSAVNNIAMFLPNGNQTNITGNRITQEMAVSGTTYGVYTTSTGSSTINNNGISQMASVAVSSQFYSIVSGGTATSETISGNVFQNTNVSVAGTLGYLALIYAANGTGNKTITGNRIVGSLTHNSNSDLYCILANPASAPANGTATIANNNFSGINKSGNGAVYGIFYAPTVASTQNYDFHDNTISNITHSGTGSIYGINYSSGATARIGKNNIHDLSSAANVFGIYSAAPATSTQADIYNNQLNNLSTTGTTGFVAAINITEGKLTNIHNNYIRDLYAPNTSKTSEAIQGIRLQNNTANTEYNVYYNTIYLNATSTGTDFSSSGIYHTVSTVATTGALDLRNNIIVNTSTANGSGITAAFRNSSPILTNYKASSNNNLYYAGAPSANKVIYYDGVNADQTLAAWQARAGAADAASISVMPNFVSATDLHLTPASNCGIDGKAMPIASITDDYDGDTRDASSPDIGADEITNTFKFVITNPAAVCAPTTVDLTTTAITAGSSAGTKTYWMDAATSASIPAANGTASAITVSGTYYIKLDNGIGCVEVKPVTVNIATPANATIGYTGSPYCQNAGTATVTQTGSTGGTYSSATGLVIDASTGDINLAASTPGTYTITYAFAAAGSCPAFSTTTSVTITAMPAATISYAASPYCQSAGTATVTQTGTTGGNYSSTTGLSINATTGAIDLAASTPGVYTVTYAFVAAGGCPAFSTTAPVTVTATSAATISYTGSPYCKNAGTVTVTQTGTTGGIYSSTTGLSINASTGEINLGASTSGNYTVTYAIAAAGGCGAFNTTASITITTSPTASITYVASPYCNNTGTATVTRTGTAGGTYSSTTGLVINTVTGDVNLGASTPGTYTITYSIAAAGGCPVFSTTASITVTAMPAAVISYPNGVYCQNAGTASVTHTGTTGGVYSCISSNLALNASTGEVNLGASMPGTYSVVYTVPAAGGCAQVAVWTPISITTPPSATIGYSASPYCPTGSAMVTQTGTNGGIYSSTTGLAIDALTGAIDLGASTPGTYTVTYSIAAAGGCAAVSTTTNIVINSLSVVATRATASITTSCGPANVNLNVAGGSLGTGANWKWYSQSCGGTLVGTGTSITTNVTATTTYYVRAEGVCNSAACLPVTVTINPQPVIILNAVPYTSLLPGRQTILMANVSPAMPGNDFTWNKNNNITVAKGAINAFTVTTDKLGTYTAQVTTPAGCTALSNPVTIKDSISYNLFIYPSPNNGLFTVSFYRPISMFYQYTTLLIYDSKGALAYSRKWLVNSSYSNIHVDMMKNSKGIYMVVLVNSKGLKLAEGKVVIQ